jgi:hypothetical protein
MSRAAAPITRIAASAYTIPTDAPESDGTLEWNATTLVLDSRHANAKGAWQRMREPEYPTAAQLARLAQASLPRAGRIPVERARGATTLRVRVPPRGVAAIDLARRHVR